MLQHTPTAAAPLPLAAPETPTLDEPEAPTLDDLRAFRFVTVIGRRVICLTRDRDLACRFGDPDLIGSRVNPYRRAPGLIEYEVVFGDPETLALAAALRP